MTECNDTTMQDRLPLLAQNALRGEEATRIRAHVASCDACAAELELLSAARSLFAAATPAVDVRRIIAAVAPPQGRPLRLEPQARARRPIQRYTLAAAASLLLVAALSVGALRELFDGGETTGTDGNVGPVGVTAVPVEILGASELDELGTDELEALLAELETLEATVVAEPITLRRPIAATPEGI